MSDFLLTVVAEHALTVLTWVLTMLGVLGAKYAWGKISNDWARGVMMRVYAEIESAVLEVVQVYTDDLKKAAADGKLTNLEKTNARSLALKTIKSNIGKKGLARLARILGCGDLDRWLMSKVESTVHNLKDPPEA
jgi:hypothetical protein